jgi:cell division FtsZ-interacting protein ZapD
MVNPSKLHSLFIELLMRHTISFLLILSICGCGKHNDPPPVKILESQRQQMQKAKEVEQIIQQAADAQRKSIDEQTSNQTSGK